MRGATVPDLRELAGSVAVFAGAIGQPLTDWQARSLVLERRLTAIMAGRQLGKSRAMAILGLWWAFRRREQHVLIVSASDHAARRVLAEAAGMARGSRLLADSVTDDQRGLLRLSNESVIRSVAASEAAVRGWSVDLGLLDEAALASDDLITGAFLPTMAARPDARAVLASSATRAAGAFYDLHRAGELGDENIAAFKWVSKLVGGDCDTPWMSATGIALDEAAMSPVRFDAEHRAIPAGGGSPLFTPQELARMFVDYVPDQLGSMGGGAKVLWGQDWGSAVDRSAGVGLVRLPVSEPGRRVVAVRAVRRWDAGAPLPAVVREIGRSPAAFKAVVAELNGLGAPCAQLLWGELELRPYTVGGGRERQPRAVLVQDRPDSPFEPPVKVKRQRFKGFVTERVGVTTSAQSKAATWSAIRLAVQKGELIAPASETDLRRELALLEVGLSQGGVEKIEASVGHDDLADALYLACAPYKRNGSPEWSCSLADLLDPRKLLPESPVPPVVAASEHVAGPDGLMVPRRPAWMSITGAELTVPEGLEFAPPPVDPALREAREQVRRALDDHDKGAGDA
jgi:hypothetical protein